jgi:hypothetical protein
MIVQKQKWQQVIPVAILYGFIPKGLVPGILHSGFF